MDIFKLNFGSDDAELDEKYGFLDKVFLKTSIYIRAKNGQRELLIGRKGAGKSAICLTLKKVLESEGIKTVFITPRSLSLQRFEQIKIPSINKDEGYVIGWKYLLLSKIGTEIFDKASLARPTKTGNSSFSKTVKKVRRFLVVNNEVEPTFFEKIWGPASALRKLISKVTLKGYGIEGSVETKQSTSQGLEAKELDRFQSSIEYLQGELDELSIVVLIDKVDEMWNDTEESRMAIIGLVKAVHELNISLRYTRTLLFLRSDIYDILRFNDADKFRTLEERLDWTENDLRYLIAVRGKFSAGLEPDDPQALWDSIFRPEYDDVEDSFHYIINRTMRRPRELIQFCNTARAVAQDNMHDQIYKEDIVAAEKLYSRWKLKDLASEFLVQYPYLEDMLNVSST